MSFFTRTIVLVTDLDPKLFERSDPDPRLNIPDLVYRKKSVPSSFLRMFTPLASTASVTPSLI
jgi:hypothetical protein